MSHFTVVYDTCVLYPAPLRDLLMQLALTGLFRARWSSTIHDEWTRSVLRNRPDLTLEQVSRTRDLMDQHVLDALVTGFEPLIDALKLPDPNDRHVLATAIASGADANVTFNAQDFPGHALTSEGITRRDPDGFLWELQSRHPETMARIIEAVRAKAEAISGQPMALKGLLKRAKLYRLAKALGV